MASALPQRPGISLILPAYNEEKTIVNTVRESHAYFTAKGWTSQIIVAADGNDRTRELARGLADEVPGLVVIGSEKRSGKGRGIRLGVELAAGDIIGFADADNKVPITEFEHFYPLLQGDYDIVTGSRALDRTKVTKRQPLVRRIGSVGFYVFVQTVVGLPNITDSQCGFKFFRHDFAKRIFALQQIDGYMYDVEILALARRMGARLCEVPVLWKDDADSRLDMVAGNIQNVKDVFRIRRLVRNAKI